MKSHLYHLQFNIDFKNLNFYKSLMEFLGWKIIFETDEVVGYSSGSSGDIWFVKSDNSKVQDHDDLGMNHIALNVDSMRNVEIITEFLVKQGIQMLFDTPKHRPEFASDSSETYYQIMFETPDKILFEVVYVGKK